ncbi:Rha family transcriptional regulator [Weissella paramesenteroides]|uniref:Rha family transcriptional regulator n=1 Tax=Weissella paramesenteroides TaxID=1249 RepID=UPI001EE28399|nr:Rha family transcriptional regulator [Weissella paramesenteroides]
MKNLVMQGNVKEGIYTTSEVVADYTNVELRTLNKLTNTYKSRLETFGKVRFEIRPLPSGQKQKIWHYNEQQATLLITFMRNTEQVADFKEALVKAFYELREEVANQRVLLERNKQVNKDLGQVIHEYLPDNQYAYSNYHTLAYKAVTGYTPKQLRSMHHIANAQEALTSEQLDECERVKQAIASLIMIGQPYKVIKQAVSIVK